MNVSTNYGEIARTNGLSFEQKVTDYYNRIKIGNLLQKYLIVIQKFQ